MAVENNSKCKLEGLSLGGGDKFVFFALFPNPPTHSLLLDMQIQLCMRLLVGSLQELGQRGRVSLETPREGLLLEESKNCLQLNCGLQSEVILALLITAVYV